MSAWRRAGRCGRFFGALVTWVAAFPGGLPTSLRNAARVTSPFASSLTGFEVESSSTSSLASGPVVAEGSGAPLSRSQRRRLEAANPGVMPVDVAAS